MWPAFIIMAIAAAASVSYSEYRKSQQIEAQKKQIKYQEKMEKRALELRTERRQRQLRSLVASQQAIFGAANIDPFTGSPLAVRAGTVEAASEDIAADQEMAAYAAGGLDYQRRVLSYEQSLLPVEGAVSFASQLAGMYGSYKAMQAPAPQTHTTTYTPEQQQRIIQAPATSQPSGGITIQRRLPVVPRA